MSIRLEMLQIARVAPKVLGESADLVREFFWRQQNPDGGFRDRSGRSDLYYTVFALEGLMALQAAVKADSTQNYLERLGDGDGLDFINLCCLARSWAAWERLSGRSPKAGVRSNIATRVNRYRSQDGGFALQPSASDGTAYGCFLGYCAGQDLQVPTPDPEGLRQCLESLKTKDGAWSNERSVLVGSTNATAAAVTVMRHLGVSLMPEVSDWLLARFHPGGGFLAAPSAPLPDLLSTATTLHALAGCQRDFGNIREPCLDFVDSLWVNEGGFHGHWGEDTLDSEYTYYGLLALGHLSMGGTATKERG